MILRKWLNSSIWPKNGTLIGSTDPDQCGPESCCKEVHHILKSSSIEASLSDAF